MQTIFFYNVYILWLATKKRRWSLWLQSVRLQLNHLSRLFIWIVIINKAKLLQFDSSIFNQFNYQNDSFANDGFNQSQWVNNNTGFNSMPQVPLSQAKMSLRPGVFGYPTSDLLNLNNQQFQTDDQFQTPFNVIFNDF